jgi:hypothetical protein
MNETEAYRKFKAGKPGFWKKLHGNKYQSGMPDIIWIYNGYTDWMEFKIVDGTTLPWSKMRLQQHLTMMSMFNAGANVYYVVWSREKECFYRIQPDWVVEETTTNLLEKGMVVC